MPTDLIAYCMANALDPATGSGYHVRDCKERNTKSRQQAVYSESDNLVPNTMLEILGLRKHRVDTTLSKYHLLPPTVFQLARLAKSSRALGPEAEASDENEFVARNLRRRLGLKIIGELVDRYNAGEHTPALAREYEVSTTGLRRLLLEEGVEFRSQSITSEDSDRAVKLYESGLTIREVVIQIGYSLGTIRRELHLRGVPMRPSGRWNHRPPNSKSGGNR